MTTTWTTITKPSVTSWTTVAKPTLASGSQIMTTAGAPIGLLMALTYSTTTSVITSKTWTDVTKPVNTSWTTVQKAT